MIFHSFHTRQHISVSCSRKLKQIFTNVFGFFAGDVWYHLLLDHEQERHGNAFGGWPHGHQHLRQGGQTQSKDHLPLVRDQEDLTQQGQVLGTIKTRVIKRCQYEKPKKAKIRFLWILPKCVIIDINPYFECIVCTSNFIG